MSETAKRLEKADKYLQKSRPDLALQEFLGILAEDPGNERVRLTAADLSLSLGRNQEAAKLLTELFERQTAVGDAPRAIASYKKLLRAGTPAIDQTFRYAQLVERTNPKEAAESYRQALQGFTAARRKKEALFALRRLIGLEPSLDNYLKEGQLAAEQKDNRGAAIAFLKAGQLQEKAGASGLESYAMAHSLDDSNREVALAYARGLLDKGDFAQAADALTPFAGAADAPTELQEVHTKALLGDKRFPEAEPFVWGLYDRDPGRLPQVVELIGALIGDHANEQALEMSRKLQRHMMRAGQQREFTAVMKEISEKHNPDREFLEFMAEVYNAANREHDYCAVLLKLFEQYYDSGNYAKAADSFDRAAEVDPYEPGHEARLEKLRGKIDNKTFHTIASRVASVAKIEEKEEPEPVAAPATGDGESTVLEDLMLQAEIFLQYSMKGKALERLERIHEVFPHEEEKTEKLRQLYNNAGYFPKYAEGPLRAEPAAAASAAPGAAAGAPAAAGAGGESAMDTFARVTEITRDIYRQGNVKGVLFTAVNQIGKHWSASRCVAGLCTPGKPPSAALEFCGPGIKQSDVMAVVKLIQACQALAVSVGTISILNVPSAQEFNGIREYVKALGIESLLAVPLMDGEEHVGILILEQCGAARNWRPTDEVMLKTISEQIVLAVNNARLRSLVKNLAVTEEKSGLLKRSSYLDVLLSEVRRALQQNSPVTVMLLHFGKASALAKEVGEPAVNTMMQQIGQVLCSHIRQNDLAVRYELTTIAVILSDTSEKNAFFVVEKLRKVLASVTIPGKQGAPVLTAGIAEAVMQSRFDPVDIVTEVINRAEAALEAARGQGGGKAQALAPQFLEMAAVTG